MPISLNETQTISKMATLLYRFLPGSKYAEVAKKLGLSCYWIGGSKNPAITQLLQATLEHHRDKFCYLIIEIVKAGIQYQHSKGNSVTRGEIVNLNQLVAKVGLRIPDLQDNEFLNSLPSAQIIEEKTQETLDLEAIGKLKSGLIKLTDLKPQERGFAFEKFLNELFRVYQLDPRSSFRIIGEQIDGSFQLGTDVYLVEAKWHEKPIDQGELLVFHAKVSGKASWSRGLFVSYNGFTPDGLAAFSKGRATNIIGMNSEDLFHILSGEMSLVDAINKKVRRAAETGDFFVSVFEYRTL